ncbi:hypothetical protein CONLIGDRAFT_120213 [Coniochaeta ligniaria NRRL 30616]|uniref:Uncharacterized protein n=1 Tax=Coniochaeta ligniaria NRRL 30616 TaxID=1408157 RepID=A0A1J7J8X2_9PEZI|nr:hypothetical protein CONLIGDRAFT_120213 [Coniochaeta ligniaria NRRL 30616]
MSSSSAPPPLLTAQLYPQQALGFFVLGASLHEVLTRIKAEPQRFPKIDLAYDAKKPVTEPVTVGLPVNGIRLQFDGPEQRLRLVEVLDFTKNHITFKPGPNEKERDLIRPNTTNDGKSSSELSPGPTFRHIYHRFLGPTFAGEYIPNVGGKKGAGMYILSYPGVAFTFPMSASAYSSGKDNVALMSSSGSQIASSMAVFSGDSWKEARENLWTEVLPSIKTFTPLSKGKDLVPDEVSLVKIHGGGKLQLFRRWNDKSTWITLGQTTEQDLIIAFGPPDARYYKSDQKMAIHKIRTASNSRTRQGNGNNDQSSSHSASASDGYDSNEDAVDDDDDDSNEYDDDRAANVSTECFYNYFYLGFDVLVTTPTKPSPPAPTQTPELAALPPAFEMWHHDRLVATKVILHSNVPGSYPFNRHRRCRWEIAYLAGKSGADSTVGSETPFDDIEVGLRQEWRDSFATDEVRLNRQKGMVINRGWGDSPGSSIELLGGWEEGVNDRAQPGAGGRRFDGGEESTTTLYGFPGLAFEVLRNGYVSALTVF